jgi:peptidoglycan/LPS O-acetylase OafA/YrhL
MQFAFFLLQDGPNTAEIQKMAFTLMAIMPILMIVGLAIIILPFWFICKKAGFSPWLSLLNIVPFGTLILIYVLAFADWRVLPVRVPGWQVPPPATPLT